MLRSAEGCRSLQVVIAKYKRPAREEVYEKANRQRAGSVGDGTAPTWSPDDVMGMDLDGGYRRAAQKRHAAELCYNNTIEIVVSGTIEISETLNIRPTRTTNGSMAWY